MSVIPTSEMVQVTLVKELIAIEWVKEDEQKDKNSSCNKSHFDESCHESWLWVV